LTDNEEDTRFLFLFCYAIQNIGKELIEKKLLNKELINVEDYFLKSEILRWQNYTEQEEKDSIFPLELKNVFRVSDKIFQMVASSQELDSWQKENILLYNFRTQRNPKITAYGEEINMDKEKINQITKRLISGDQFPDPIILNILNNGDSRIDYNENKHILTIYDGSVINVVDGFHRKTANSLALVENPNLNFNWQITFTFLTENAAHDYMSQKDKQKPMKKEWSKQFDYSREENLIIDAILDDKLSELGKVMKDSDEYIKLEKALTKKSIVALAIKECYSDLIEAKTNIRQLAKWIVEVTDYVMSLYTDEFIINPYQTKEISNINHKNMFFGYIALSKALYDKKNWKNLIQEKMDSIDFSVNNPLWRKIGLIGNKDAKKVLRNNLYDLFAEGV
jgi:hypothetical protein